MTGRDTITDRLERAKADAFPVQGEGGTTDTPLGFGVCNIDTNSADGTYTITERVFNSTSGLYEDADGGFSGVAAREINDSSLLQVDDPALFVETQTKNGETEYTIIGNASAMFPVKVTQTGGSAGDKTTQCSFTYTVDSLDGTELATVQAPAKSRPSVGKLAAPPADSYGLAFYDGATLVLYDANETLAPAAC